MSKSKKRSRGSKRLRRRRCSKTASSRRRLPSFFASEVADSLASYQQCTEKEHNALFLVAIDIGQHLADGGHPGCWHRFTAIDFYPKLSFLGPTKLEDIGLRAMSMFHHLAELSALPRNTVERISRELCDFGPQSEAMASLHAAFARAREPRRSM